MLIGEAIQRTKQLYNKGVESVDSRLSNRYVYSKLRTVRERIVSQELKKKQIVNEWTYQTLPCFPMVLAPTHECPCVPSEGCEILRSECKLPQIFTDDNRHIIKSVSKITGTGDNFLDIQFGETSWMRVKYQAGYKFAKVKAEFFIHNDYLFVIHNKTLELITVVAIFNDPLQAALACDYCDTVVDPCKSYLDFDIHIDGKLEESLCQLAAEEIIYIYAQMRADDRNNTYDDTGASLENPRSYREVNKNVNRNDV